MRNTSTSAAAEAATAWIKTHGGELRTAARSRGLRIDDVLGAAWLAAQSVAARGGDAEAQASRIIAAALYTERDAEPVQRGHRGHSYAVALDECVEITGGDTPDGLLEAAEAIEAAAAGSSWHAQAVADVSAGRVERHEPHKVRSERTLRRRRAAERESGQQGFSGFGWSA